MNTKLVVVLVVSSFLVACGGGGGGSSSSGGTTIATGYFKDAATSGLGYESGSQSGVTDSNGMFRYESGQPVTFAVGGVVLGTVSQGKEIVTPADLVTNGTVAHPTVHNLVRFLLALDSDNDPSNGIAISRTVQALSGDWDQINFSAADFDESATALVQQARPDRTLTNAQDAQTHLTETLRCAYSGAFGGTYTGDDTGRFGILVRQNGDAVGVMYNQDSNVDTLAASTPINVDDGSFVSETTSGATLTGRFTSLNDLSGSWQSSGYTGQFSGARVGGSLTAKYRYTGMYSGVSHGVFTSDVDASNVVTGLIYDVPTDESYELTGTLVGTTLQARADNGVVISGTLDTGSGALSGNWSWVDPANGNVADGTFSGDGCML